MDSKELLQKLMSGSYGITRDGSKAIYIGKEFYSSTDEFPHAFLIVESEIRNSEIEWYSENLKYSSQSPLRLSPNDIVGLWEDKPEPFNLGRALAGEMIVGNGVKYWLRGQLKSNEDYYILEEELGDITTCFIGKLNNQFTMYKEPEPVKLSTDDLPKPIREFGDLEEVWYVQKYENQYKPYSSNKKDHWVDQQEQSLNNGCYYATEEDCQKICDWLMNR